LIQHDGRVLMLIRTNFGIVIARGIDKKGIAMTNTNDRQDLPELKDEPTESQHPVEEKLNFIANKAAKKARLREKRYDIDHDIFTK